MENIFIIILILCFMIFSLVIVLIWIHTEYHYDRELRRNDYVCPKTQKKFHREFVKKIGVIPKEYL